MTSILPGNLGVIAAAGVGPSTWDPANTTAYVSLTNSNKSAIASTTNPTNFGMTRGIKSHNSGKFYFEITITTIGTVNDTNWWGAIDASMTVAASTSSAAYGPGVVPSPISIGITIYPGSYFAAYVNGNSIGSGTIGSVPAVGDAIMVAIDFTGKVFIGAQNVWNNGTGVTGTADQTFPSGTTAYPSVALGKYQANPYFSGTLNSAGPFKYALPSGFSPWG